MNDQLSALAQSVAKTYAKYHGKPVEVDIEADCPTGKVAIKGDFGNAWTHGGYTPVTKLVVAVSDLTNTVAYLSNGEVVHAKG